MKANVNRNSIYLLKIITTIMILLHHYYCAKYYIGWYIGVEFFFIVSGYLLKKKIDSEISMYDLIEDRIKRLYPTYIGAIVILLAFHMSVGWVSPEQVIERILTHVPELLMIHMFGNTISGPYGFMNDIGWYVSAMFLATVFYTVVYKKFSGTNWVNHFVFVGVALFYGYNCVYCNTGMDFWGGIRYHNDAIFRALGAMGIGILLAELSKLGKIVAFIKKHSKISTVLVMILFAYVWLYMFQYPNTKYDLLMILIFGVVIFVAFHAEVSVLLDNPVIRYVSNASYVIYLLQMLWLHIFRFCIPFEDLVTVPHMILFVVINFVSGIVLYEINQRLGKAIRKR